MELWMKVIIDSQPWELDASVINTPWRIVKNPDRPLRLGVITEHPKRPLHPDMLRCMRSVETAIADGGHSIIPLDGKITDMWEAANLSWEYFGLDPKLTPAKYIQESGEHLVPSMVTLMAVTNMQFEPTVDTLFDMNMEQAGFMQPFHDLMVRDNLDGFIMPAYQATAVPHDTYGLPVYTVLSNLLDYPTGFIPYLEADKEKDRDYVRNDVSYEPPCKYRKELIYERKADATQTSRTMLKACRVGCRLWGDR
jgi:hypothetical protein